MSVIASSSGQSCFTTNTIGDGTVFMYTYSAESLSYTLKKCVKFPINCNRMINKKVTLKLLTETVLILQVCVLRRAKIDLFQSITNLDATSI